VTEIGAALPLIKPKQTTHMELKWHAVYTKPRWEKKVAESLTKRKYENYCPLNLMIRQWSDRKMKVYEPLFTSYVFIRTCEKELTEIRNVTGILSVVHWLNRPAIIKDHEIDAIKVFLGEYKSVQLEKAVVNPNDRVRVLNGPLREYEGDVLEVRNNTVKVFLPSLGYAMVAEIQKSNVEVINYKLVNNKTALRFALR
jgi:transcription antitermination factor NusG